MRPVTIFSGCNKPVWRYYNITTFATEVCIYLSSFNDLCVAETSLKQLKPFPEQDVLRGLRPSSIAGGLGDNFVTQRGVGSETPRKENKRSLYG